MAEIYNDPIIKKYIQLIEAKTDGIFRGYYQGDPIRIPSSKLPAIVLSKAQTRIGPLTNAEDEHGMAMILSVVVDIRDEISDDTQIAPGVARLYDIMEGREEATYKLKANSLLNILRTSILVDATYNLRTDLSSITQADYGLTIGKRSQEGNGYAVEGQIEFIAYYTQLR